MRVFYSRVHDLGVPIRLRYVSACDPVSASTCEEHSEAIVLDVTFVDDEAIAVVATVPRTMTSKIKLVINVLKQTFTEFGMTINWSPGKTELLCKWRGKRAKAENQSLVHRNGMKLLTVTAARRRAVAKRRQKTLEQDIQVNCVPRYKHLGSIIDNNLSLQPEARCRERSALNSFTPIATKILGNKSIAPQRRIRLDFF